MLATVMVRPRGCLVSAYSSPYTTEWFIVRDANGQALAYVYAPGVVTADQLGPRRGAKWWPRPRIADQSEVRIEYP